LGRLFTPTPRRRALAHDIARVVGLLDLAHVPEAVSTLYPGADQRLLGECRNLVLAMVAAWRCDPGGQLPDGPRQLRALLRALRDGPPWPAIDDIGGGGALVR
jgi:hypothetical protein